jgi:hypothetical protein
MRPRIERRIGPLLLAIYLILQGLALLTDFRLPFSPLIMGLLALIAGIFLLVGR